MPKEEQAQPVKIFFRFSLTGQYGAEILIVSFDPCPVPSENERKTRPEVRSWRGAKSPRGSFVSIAKTKESVCHFF